MTRALIYQHPSTTWVERLPLGNGRLGAMVGAQHDGVHIALNESSAWSGGHGSALRDRVSPHAARRTLASARGLFDDGAVLAAEVALRPLQHRYAQSFLPVGELSIVFAAGSSTSVLAERGLALSDGVHAATHRIGEHAVVSQTCVPVASDILIHEITASCPISVRLALTSPLRIVNECSSVSAWHVLLQLPADVAPGHEPGEPPVRWNADGVDPAHVAVSVVVTHDGTEAWHGDVLVVERATRLRVTLAAETTFAGVAEPLEATDRAVARARQRAEVSPIDDPFAAHRTAHGAAQAAVQVTLGNGDATPSASPVERIEVEGGATPENDPELLALLFDYGRYLLRSCSRANGMPANLQGIWNEQMQPPWSSNFTLNINTPMNYWGAEAVGESGSHLALLNLLEGLAISGADTAHRLYGARGWVAHHNTDVWGYSMPTRGGLEWALWPMGGAWLVRQFDEHRRFGAMSDHTLHRFWPVARGCAQFLLDFAALEAGRMHTFPSTSPENTYRVDGRAAALTRSSALDRALMRDVFGVVAELATLAGQPDDTVAAQCREALHRVAAPAITAHGQIQEWGTDVEAVDAHHRHLSHLYPWFPGDAPLDGDRDDALAAAVVATLNARGDDSTGWSLVWKIALWARLGDGPRVETLLRLFLRPAAGGREHRGGLYPNLFAAHPPFQIDGNLGFVGAFAEVFVQSHRPGRIDLLHGLPPSLRTGAVQGLMARPGIRIDLDWADASLRQVALRAVVADAAGPRVITAHGHRRTVDIPFGSVIVVDWPRLDAPGSA